MSEPTHGLARRIGFAGALGIGLGTMLGAGIFVLSGRAAGEAGPAAALSYILAGLIVLPIAMSISELVTAMPREGGSYHLISRTLGPLAGAVVGPTNWLGLIFATGFYLIGFAEYLRIIVPLPTWLSILAAGLGFIYLNYRGARAAATVEALIVGVLLLLLIAYAVGSTPRLQQDLLRPFMPSGWSATVGVIGLIIVSYTGFEKISTVAEETRDPGRTLPRAILGAVVVATVVYGGVLLVATGLLPYEELGRTETPLVDSARSYGGDLMAGLMVFAVLLATASSANAAIIASSRINYAMGRDRILPHWFSELHDRHHTPHRSILLTGGAAVALALTGEVHILAETGSALFMISYALLVTGLIVMRRLSPEWYRPSFRVPLFPWLPGLAGLLSLAVILTMDRLAQIGGLGLVSLSLVWYFAYGRSRTPVEGELQALKHRSTQPEGARPRAGDGQVTREDR